MLQVQSFDQCHFNQSQLYEDLSQIIKAFKSLLTSMDSVAINIQKYQSTSNLLQEIKQTLKILQAFSKIYNITIDQRSQHKNTFHRFICRLIESISAYKLKLQTLPYSTILATEIKQIELIVLSYQNDKNLSSIIKKIHNVVSKFCTKTIKAQQNSLKSTQNNESVLSYDKKSQFTKITHEYQNSQDSNATFTLTINEIKPKKILQSKSENSLNKVMNMMNRKYRTLACLDIEFQQFKQLFFRSRDAKDQLYEDCFQRNNFILKEILRYSKQFTEFLQKRDQKIFRKNKFVDSLGQNNIKIKSKIPFAKGEDPQKTNYNFTKKKIINETKKSTIQYNQSISQDSSQQNSPFLLARSQVIQDKVSNLILERQEMGKITPQLIDDKRRSNIFPLMLNNHHFLQDKVQQISAQTFLELSKRKKNLQLKKIDISLTSFSNGTSNQIQSAKLKNKIINPDQFKKTVIQTSKKMQDKINASIRKNYLQKKYEQAMKKNTGQSMMEFEQQEDKQLQTASKFSSTKLIDIEQSCSPTPLSKQRKYLIKTSNKRPINPGTQYKSLNPVNQRKQVSTIKNFRKHKMDQIQKIQRLSKMKQTAINHIQLLSGGKAIRPTIYYRQKQMALNSYTQVTEEDFSDVNLGSHKEFEMQQRVL